SVDTPTASPTATSSRTATASPTATPIRTATVAPSPTVAATPIERTLYVVGNLAAQARDGETVLLPTRIAEPGGRAHDLTLRFVKVSAAHAWDWQAVATDPTVATPNPLGSGTITFDTDGWPLDDPTRPEGQLRLDFVDGATPLRVGVELDTLTGRDGYSHL